MFCDPFCLQAPNGQIMLHPANTQSQVIQMSDGQIYQLAPAAVSLDPASQLAAVQQSPQATQIITLPGGTTLNQNGATAAATASVAAAAAGQQQLMVVPGVSGAHKLPLTGGEQRLKF